jgi:hypothetical protein
LPQSAIRIAKHCEFSLDSVAAWGAAVVETSQRAAQRLFLSQ